jgi:hypothetical protein
MVAVRSESVKFEDKSASVRELTSVGREPGSGIEPMPRFTVNAALWRQGVGYLARSPGDNRVEATVALLLYPEGQDGIISSARIEPAGLPEFSTILDRVVVLPTELHIDLSKSVLSQELLGKATVPKEQDGLIELREPLQIARRGSEVRLILENGEQQEQDSIPSLVRAVTQARTPVIFLLIGRYLNFRVIVTRGHLPRAAILILQPLQQEYGQSGFPNI